MNNIPGDLLVQISTYLNPRQILFNTTVNKQFFSNSIKALQITGFNYAPFPESVQNFDKFRKSSVYPYCKSLEIPSLFNAPLKLPPNLTTLSMGHHFNQSICLPNSLQILRLGLFYDQHIDLPPNLKEFRTNLSFDRPVQLPQTLTYLFMDFVYSYNNYIQLVLPPNLQTLATKMPEGIKFHFRDANGQYQLGRRDFYR